MKRFPTISVCVLLLSASISHAAPYRDVPTQHWASGAIKRLTAHKILVPSNDGKFHGDKPVTRYELAVTLDRLVQFLEAGRKPLAVTATKSAVMLPPSADNATRQALLHLSTDGFIDAHSPLLQTNKVVTAQELTDVLSRLTVRLSEIDTPPTKQ